MLCISFNLIVHDNEERPLSLSLFVFPFVYPTSTWWWLIWAAETCSSVQCNTVVPELNVFGRIINTFLRNTEPDGFSQGIYNSDLVRLPQLLRYKRQVLIFALRFFGCGL